MAETRSAEEIRQSIEANRAELGLAVNRLRGEVTRATDWREAAKSCIAQLGKGPGNLGFLYATDLLADQFGEIVEVVRSTTIGNQRLTLLPQPITTERLRLRILKSPVCPVLSELAVFLEPLKATSADDRRPQLPNTVSLTR